MEPRKVNNSHTKDIKQVMSQSRENSYRKNNFSVEKKPLILFSRSILHPKDRLEFFLAYCVVFSSSFLLDFAKNYDIHSHMLLIYVQNFINHSKKIIFIISTIAIIVYYQFHTQSKNNMSCRLLVGDTKQKIKIRYFIELLSLLLIASILFTSIYAYFHTNINSMHISFGFLLLYASISTLLIGKNHENL
ncbi:MAG: hypothetical protein J6M18_00860 [Actinomycetaceae bacterium]|nr:hypothetical protein [Actinomycetaceae bacterium]